jgi:hypothetical protein
MEPLKHYQSIELELAAMTQDGDIPKLPLEEQIAVAAIQYHTEKAIRLNVRRDLDGNPSPRPTTE